MTRDKPLFHTTSGQQSSLAHPDASCRGWDWWGQDNLLPGARRMVAAARLALLLLGCVGLLQPVAGRYINYCPDGWYYYKLSCFKYFRDPQTWDEAERQCQAVQDGAHLAWVEEHQEAATLRKAISYYQRVRSVWIGLQQGKENEAWQWTSGKDYSVASGLPGNGARGGSCAMLTYHSGFTVWSSADCTQKHHYVCKFYPLH